MKITIVQGAFFPVPPIRGGAVEKIWYGLGREFARRGHEVLHISKRDRDLPKTETIDGVRHVRVRGYKQPANIYWLKCLDYLYTRRALRRLEPADILVCNTFWLPLLANPSKHGLIYVHNARYPKGQMFLYKKAARVQTVSEAIRKAILEQTPTLENVGPVINNPLPPDYELTDLEDTANKDPNLIIYVGRVHPEKGLEILIRSFVKLKKTMANAYRLRIIGPWDVEHGGGGKGYLGELKRLAQPVAEDIDFTGPIYESGDLQREYEQAQLLVYPSVALKGESFGLTPVEAMAKGCIPITSDLECFLEFMADRNNGFVFSLDGDPVANLTDVLAAIADNKFDLKALRRNAIDTASYFLPSRIAEKYLEDFQLLLEEAAAGSED